MNALPGAAIAALALSALLLLAPIIAVLAAVSPAQAFEALTLPPGREAAITSLEASLSAVAIAALLGVPAGYALSRASAPWSAPIAALLALPLAFPPIASGIMLLQLVGTRAPLGALLSRYGIVFVDTLWGVALAEFFVCASLVIVASAAAFSAVDPVFEETAATLGASSTKRFFRVALPLAAPGVLSGVLLAWMRAIGEYGATSVLAYHPTALPVQLYVTLSAQGVGPALALSYGFIVLAAVVVAAQWALRRRVV